VLLGDRVALREMLRNLVDNALAYSDGPVEIAVSVPRAGTVRLAVSDRGPGVAEALKPRILERFSRGDSVEGKVGSGLGLAIVHRVVEAHVGTLALLDRAGGGLEVVVDLPLGAGPAGPRGGGPMAAKAATAVAAVVAARWRRGAHRPPRRASCIQRRRPKPGGW
jgi:two-component system, OmpR family, sensor histidine kinase TctE